MDSEYNLYLKDIPSTLFNFASVDDLLFFTAYGVTDNRAVFQLWVSDGTTEGTVPVRDFNPGGHSALELYQLTAFDGRLFFFACDWVHGVEPWVSDGTPEGTYLLKDIIPGWNDWGPGVFVVLGDELHFSAHNSTGGWDLWTTDGTEAGTVLVKNFDLNPGYLSIVYWLLALDDRLFFTDYGPGIGRELWVWDMEPPVATYLPLIVN